MLLKKGFPAAVREARRAAARRGRRLRIMFTDEARFGRMNRIRPCWAPVGTRPAVAAQLIREYVYLYGAVSPKDGTCVYLSISLSWCERQRLTLTGFCGVRHDLWNMHNCDAAQIGCDLF